MGLFNKKQESSTKAVDTAPIKKELQEVTPPEETAAASKPVQNEVSSSSEEEIENTPPKVATQDSGSVSTKNSKTSLHSVPVGPNRKSSKAPVETMAGVTKVNERLNKALENATFEKNSSPQLIPLSQEFEEMRKTLKALIAGAKGYHETYMKLSQQRTVFLASLSKLSKGTPLEKAISSTTNQDSMASLNQGLVKNSKDTATSFQKNVVSYVVEWERIVSQRVETEMDHVKKLQDTRIHYEEKVDKLRDNVHHKEEKGKATSKGMQEKLDRNELKLRDAFEAHEAAAGKACALIKEVVQKGWKDMYPLAKSFLEFEFSRANKEKDILLVLPDTIGDMTSDYKSNEKA